MSIPRWTFLPRLLSGLLFVTAFVAQALVAWKFWALTWDDSAITLGFARTFASTGRIEPTPHSGIVEGYSTTLWLLLMTLAAKLVASPSALLIVAKISSFSLNLLNLFLIRRWISTWAPIDLATLVAGIWGCCFAFYETINGMETPLVLALILTLLLLQRSNGGWARAVYLATGIALMLTRWEAAWFLIPFVLLERPVRLALVSAGTWAAAFLLTNVIRWYYFGSILPNTITAKRGIPYSFGSPWQQLRQHLHEPVAIVHACRWIAVVTLCYFIYRYLQKDQGSVSLRGWLTKIRRYYELKFAVVFVVFSILLSTAIGPNWGPPLRSFFAGWPFLIALLLLPFAADFSLPKASTAFSLAILAISGLTFFVMSHRIRELSFPEAPVYMARTTVDNVRKVDEVLKHIQTATTRHHLLFAGPDMGAVLLFSDGITVLDLGMLCDRTLAHERFAAMETYVLTQRRPDVIEVHGMWTTLTHFDTSSRFYNDYRPVLVDGMRVFLRKDLIQQIAPGRLQKTVFDPSNYSAAILGAPLQDRVDETLNRKFGSYLVLK